MDHGDRFPSGTDGPMPARDDDVIDVFAVVGVLRRRKLSILAIAAVGGLIGALLGLRITPEYTAQATVVVKPTEDPLAEHQAPPVPVLKDPAAFNTQQKTIQSRTHVEH